MKKIILKVDGMSCSACSNGLEKYLNKQKGIKEASVNLVLAQALITYEDYLTIDDLNRFIEEAGFTSLGEYNLKEDNKKDYQKYYLIILGLLAILLMYIAMGHMLHLPMIPYIDMMHHKENYVIILFILTIPFLIYGIDIFKSGIKNIIHKTPNMDTLVTLGVWTSFIYSFINMLLVLINDSSANNLYFESCAMIIFFIKLGRYIDGRSKEKTKEAIKELVQITPTYAYLKVGDDVKKVTIDEVKKGDILVCKPGDKVAVDGNIINGSTHLDEKFITGESFPSKKEIGDQVMAGTINIDGYIEYQAVRIGADSTISEIVHLVMEASNTKAPIQKLADKVCSYFVPSIIALALLTLIVNLILGHNDALISCVTVLVVACPCALGLATPLAMVISMGNCAKKGILVKNSTILEEAHHIDTIVFDKTGTLTYGDLKIAKIYNFSKLTDDELIRMITSLEQTSNHPISKAFVEYAKEHDLKLDNISNVHNISGIGLTNDEIYIGNNKLFKELNLTNKYEKEESLLTKDGCSIVYLIKNNQVLGLVGVKDVIRSHMKEIINNLKKLNIDIIMLTGDNDSVAQKVGKSVNIDHIIAGVLPSEKNKVIKKLINEGKKVMMVGDGINDAPSLASATIGISVNSGSDIALDTSDVILMNDNLDKIESLILISKKAIRNIKQNLFWAFFYNLCMIPIALGIFKPTLQMNPMLGSLAMTCSSLTVMLNALRLKK